MLDVGLSAPVAADRPFAALRSMFVTEGNADVAQVGWRGKDSPAWTQMPVMYFKSASAAELWAGRTVPSRHNTSAPDMIVPRFQRDAALSIPFSSANAPANGWKVKRTTCLPGGTTTARNSTLAFRISAGLPSTVARHHGCQTSLSTTKPPPGASASISMSVLR